MTPELARAIRALGCWGEQGGLLSIAEMRLLYELVQPFRLALEVGHYCGLSTRTLVMGGHTHVVTVDSHKGDRWVPEPAGTERFLANMDGDEHVIPLFIDSQALVAPLAFPFVFYDGDHGEEQERFTRAVIDSPRVALFVFDDRDFPHPMRCEELLREAGWRDESPPLHRGAEDKRSEDTMTLGVWRRA